MQNAASFHQLQSQEQLLGIGAHSLDVKADVFAILLQHLSQIHTAQQQVSNLYRVLTVITSNALGALVEREVWLGGLVVSALGMRTRRPRF